jgi:hypothetical protein
MPGFNQKGPMGQGSMTGRRMGRCTNYGANLKDQTDDDNQNSTESFSGNFQGRGLGRGRSGRGLGMGQQNRFRGGQ